MRDQTETSARASLLVSRLGPAVIILNAASSLFRPVIRRWRFDFMGVFDVFCVACGLIVLCFVAVALIRRLRTGVWTWP